MQSKHAQTSLRPYGRDSGAHWTGRADGQAKPFPHLRAHKRIHPEADRIESSETVRVELDVLPPTVFCGTKPRNQNVSRGTIPRTPLPFFPRAGTDKQIPTPEYAITPNARLNHRREAAGFILRMFQLHDQRPRGVGSMFSSINQQFAKARGDRLMIWLRDRASLKSQRSAPIRKTQIPHRTKSRKARNPAADFPLHRQTPAQSVDNPPASLYNKEKRHRRRQ